MTRLAVFLSIFAVAACGGGPKSTTIENKGPMQAAAGVLPGAYPCGFVYEGQGDIYGPFRCAVEANKITKAEGMEPFTGVVTATPTGAHLEATIGPRCDMASSCGTKFSVELTKSPTGTLVGHVVHAGAPADWWLGTATFEIRNAGMGGDQYGKAFPGGE